MNRRKFIKNSSLAASSTFFIPNIIFNKKPGNDIVGHGSYRYKVVKGWGILDSSKTPVNDCHEMVQDSKGRIVLLTNETKNNIIIYDKSGKLLKTWGNSYPGGHGLSLAKENGEDFLFITDPDRHEVIKTTVDGEELMTLGYPKECGKYQNADQYKPTEVAIAPNGDFYVADGYGEQYVIQYNHKGEFVRCFGGRGDKPENLKNAHGIAVDLRDKNQPVLIVTSREENAIKRYTLDGKYLSTIELPGAFICRPVMDDENIYFAVLISHLPWTSESGFVTILDKNNKVVSNPGGTEPKYQNGKLQPMAQAGSLFKHPHDVCVDDDKNIYIAQWNSGKVYPIKLERVI